MKRTGQVNEFETYIPIEIDLEKFSLEEGTNKVLVKTFRQDVKQTVGGLVTEGVETFNFAENTERRGVVVKTVKEVVPGQNGIDMMMHDCDVEIQEGDEVYFNHFDNINSFKYIYKDEIYKLIPYSAIILAIRKEQVIMCNGYLLLEEIEQREKIGNIFVPYLDETKTWIVKHKGSLNRKYFLPVLVKDIPKYLENNPDQHIYSQMSANVLINHPNRTDEGTQKIKDGDRVLIGDTRWIFPLEVYAYARFDDRKVYSVCPRHAIIAMMTD